ncbi:zinc finger protein 575 isoform X1 [Moschus berezovskii]|uniref:zinc finger protein 575 isoform X1 n=1 Tax=Moschus berezovskii TaxID=68408 RepID=UPI002444B3BA|nr:zinc finger protein 575 isoform X1 [Moschus berezovskii]
MRTDAPTGPTWEEGMEMRLGPAARARSLLFPPVAGWCSSPASEGSAAVATAAKGGARSPAPREGPSAGLSSPLHVSSSTPGLKRGARGVNGLRLSQELVQVLPLGFWASRMLEREAESAAGGVEPSPTDKEPVTKGEAPDQGPPQKPSQSVPEPAASTRAPSRPRRRPPPQRPHRCPDCDKAFSYPSKLATHRLAHGGARPHPCPDCPKAFSYPSKLAAHRLTHSGARPHPCPHCPKAFGHRSKLAAHLWTHAPARPYPCPDCPKSFCYPSKLAAHRHTHHATDARPYPCPHCPKAFSFPSKLAAHRLCHDPPTAPGSQATARHRCSSCDQAFGQRRLLLVHQRSHHQAESPGERE